MGNKDLKSYGGDKDGEEENVTSSSRGSLLRMREKGMEGRRGRGRADRSDQGQKWVLRPNWPQSSRE